jgi:hypothetical protein
MGSVHYQVYHFILIQFEAPNAICLKFQLCVY